MRLSPTDNEGVLDSQKCRNIIARTLECSPSWIVIPSSCFTKLRRAGYLVLISFCLPAWYWLDDVDARVVKPVRVVFSHKIGPASCLHTHLEIVVYSMANQYSILQHTSYSLLNLSKRFSCRRRSIIGYKETIWDNGPLIISVSRTLLHWVR